MSDLTEILVPPAVSMVATVSMFSSVNSLSAVLDSSPASPLDSSPPSSLLALDAMPRNTAAISSASLRRCSSRDMLNTVPDAKPRLAMSTGREVVATTNSFWSVCSGSLRHMTLSVCNTELRKRAPPPPPTNSMMRSMSSRMIMDRSLLYAFSNASMMAELLLCSPAPTNESAEMCFTNGKPLSAASLAAMADFPHPGGPDSRHDVRLVRSLRFNASRLV
mmetsp:Transcript_63649/g.129254  ORF Transcript_63649/g.129254 Transcript_63649/m.129254 type:complete len:220 (-) Transcript_63649:1640-2299(-)